MKCHSHVNANSCKNITSNSSSGSYIVLSHDVLLKTMRREGRGGADIVRVGLRLGNRVARTDESEESLWKIPPLVIRRSVTRGGIFLNTMVLSSDWSKTRGDFP